MHSNDCFCSYCCPPSTLGFPDDLCACRGYNTGSTFNISGYCEGLMQYHVERFGYVEADKRCRSYFKRHVKLCRMTHGTQCSCYTCWLIKDYSFYEALEKDCIYID